MPSEVKHLYFVGLDDFNRETLAQLPHAAECEFHAALTLAEMRDGPDVDIAALVERAAERMASGPGGPDGVASFFDFPGTIIAAVLAERFGLAGPSLASLLTCEHKYWGRLEQQKVVPDSVPLFRAFDPAEPDAFAAIGMVPPFWVKPVKSFRSYLAYAIHDERQFAEVMEVCRAEGHRITAPFLRLMRAHGMPRELTESHRTFLAESAVTGAQCTVEGYVHHGRVVLYGVVDSVREPGSSSFARYEYPSVLPLEIQHRMMDVARAVMHQLGYDDAPFNAEFFFDQTTDTVWLLEVNPRASQSHADLFHKVDGTSSFSVVVDLALGRTPRALGREGCWDVAAHFFVRAREPGRVTDVPGRSALERLRARQGDTRVQIMVRKGTDLSRLPNQDSYSYELATVDVGGRDRTDLLDRYDQVLDVLRFEIEPADGS